MNCVLPICVLFSLAMAIPLVEVKIKVRQVQISEDPEIYLDTEGIIKRWEYPVEKYDVTTEDGYILTIFRIPHGRKQSETPKGPRPVVLLQHGFLGSSDMWVNNLPDQTASYILADGGYDVWLGNFRGNKYGRNHVKLSADRDQKAFFDFSWPEMAQYDLPAMIDQILKVTGAPCVYYIGHSMGTLVMFVKLSQDKIFAKKVKRFYALAPVLKLNNVDGLVRTLSVHHDAIEILLNTMGVEEFMPSSWLSAQLAQLMCGSNEGNFVCANTLFMFAGPDSSQLNKTRIPVYLAHTPSGTSRRTFVHFGQMIKNGLIGQYDHGTAENTNRYGSATPPEYDISTIDTPISLYWGDKDWLSTDKDIQSVTPVLHSVVSKNYLEDFNHMDFLWGSRAPKEIYTPIFEDIQKDFQGGACKASKMVKGNDMM